MAVIDIIAECDAWQAHDGLDTAIEAAALAALAGAGVQTLPDAEIAIMLGDDAAVRTLNKRWRKLDKPTNVLSFPAVAPELLAQNQMIGDLALAYETCAREAADEGKRFEHHIAHLVVHGVLHLIGYDHESERDAEEMEALERKVLAGLAIPDPYAETGGTP